MLILTRRTNESIIIGNDAEIKVTPLSIKGNQIRIGIDAPKEIPVYREEIYQRICDEKSQGQQDVKMDFDGLTT